MKRRNINKPKLAWTFLDGSNRVAVTLKSVAIGKGKYLPGWRWSKHVGAMTGKQSESHIGFILSGKMKVRSPSGIETLLNPGDAFEIGPRYDAWVVGKEACIALDFVCVNNQKKRASG
jgi:hypothetical protein